MTIIPTQSACINSMFQNSLYDTTHLHLYAGPYASHPLLSFLLFLSKKAYEQVSNRTPSQFNLKVNHFQMQVLL